MASSMLCTVKKKELIRFIITGSCAVLTDFSVYQLLLFLGVMLEASKALSFITGSFLGFILNKKWSFESQQDIMQSLWRYVVLYTVTAVINSSVNTAILLIFNLTSIAFLGATGVSMVLNFVGLKFFVFKK